MKLKPALRNLPHRFPGQTIRASLGCALTLCIMILCSTLIFVSIFKIWGIFFVSFIQFNVFFKTLINKTYSFVCVCGGGTDTGGFCSLQDNVPGRKEDERGAVFGLHPGYCDSGTLQLLCCQRRCQKFSF